MRNTITGEEISYRQSIKRGIKPGVLPKVPVRYPKISASRPYKKRKEWIQGKWQLSGKYLWVRQEDEVDKIHGFSKAYTVRDYPTQHQEAIDFSATMLIGTGWRYSGIIWERWLRY